MTTDLNHLRYRLESECKNLTEGLRQLEASVRQASEQREKNFVSKWDESATDSSEVERCLALQIRILASLAEVEHALHKLDNGTYGLCDRCGQPINPARLEALPQANLCLNCKTHQPTKTRIRSFPGKTASEH